MVYPNCHIRVRLLLSLRMDVVFFSSTIMDAVACAWLARHPACCLTGVEGSVSGRCPQ